MNTSYQSEREQLESTLEPKHNGLFDLIVIFLTAIFCMAYAFDGMYEVNLLVITLHFVCTYAMYKEKKYGCFFFYLTFFLFLLGTIFFGLFDSTLKYKFQSVEIEKHVLFSLAIAIVSVYVGAELKERKIVFGNFGRNKRIDLNEQGPDRTVSNKMSMFLKYACIVTLIADLVNALAKAVFVMGTSYISYYTDYEAPLPYFVLWLASVGPFLYYLYIGSLPQKRDITFPTILYILGGVVSLFYGQRNVLVVRSIIIMCYLLIRNKYASNGEKWITKRQIRIIIILLPFAITFMSFWRSYRGGFQYENKNLFEGVIEGLLNQGNDLAILDYEYRYRSLMPDKPYAIGGIIGLLRNNIIARILHISPVPSQNNTVELAINGYSFASALMYEQNRNGYLLGFGIGSSYIAELCNSFGYIGICLGSVLYGIILNKLGKFRIRGFIVNGIVLSMLQQLLMAPRSTFDSFITSTFSIAHLFVLVVCWLLNKHVWIEGKSNG